MGVPVFFQKMLNNFSEKPQYQKLHSDIINYLKFLRDKSRQGNVDEGLLKALYCFKEVSENWLGFSVGSNKGHGLGMKFARSLNENLVNIFKDFGNEKITKGSHLEKICLISKNVGRDNISDFTTNLIKDYLLCYTQAFAQTYLQSSQTKQFAIGKAIFHYDTGTWGKKDYTLPVYKDKKGKDRYVILTPKDILTKDDVWISRSDMLRNYDDIVQSVDNDQLRGQLNEFFRQQLPEKPVQKDFNTAIENTFKKYPALIEYYIREKENDGDGAVAVSKKNVQEVERQFIDGVFQLLNLLENFTVFFKRPKDTYEEAMECVQYLKTVIEDKDGYRIFYDDKKNPIKREKDVQILFKLVWKGSSADVNAEVNNGRGPVDFAISRGKKDKTLVEFKLASNTGLEKNLKNQVKIYEKASEAQKSIKVILFFSDDEEKKINRIFNDLNLHQDKSIVLVDARNSNKPSASTVK